MDLIGYTSLSNQLGKVIDESEYKYIISWITEQGIVGNITLYKRNVSINLLLYEYINFDVERDFRYKWMILKDSVKQTYSYLGKIENQLEHLCRNFDDNKDYTTNIVTFDKFKTLQDEIVYFCLGNSSFSKIYNEDGSECVLAIKTHVLLYTRILKLQNYELRVRCNRLKLNLKYNIPKFVDISLLENLNNVYVVLNITKRDFTKYEQGIDTRSMVIDAIIIENYGEIILENEVPSILCSFGKITIDNQTQLLKSVENVLVRSYIDKKICHEIYINMEGTVRGNHILGTDNIEYKLKSIHIIGGILLENEDTVKFEIYKEVTAKNIILTKKIKGYPKKLYESSTTFYERRCDIICKEVLDNSKMYSFSVEWNKEWRKFLAIDIEEVTSEDPLDIKEVTNKAKDKSNKHMHEYYTNSYIYPTNMAVRDDYQYNPYYSQIYRYTLQNVNPDDIW